MQKSKSVSTAQTLNNRGFFPISWSTDCGPEDLAWVRLNFIMHFHLDLEHKDRLMGGTVALSRLVSA